MLASCWADFPASRFAQDRGTPNPERRDFNPPSDQRPDQASREASIREKGTDDLRPGDQRIADQLPADKPKTLDVVITCAPGSFVACANSNKDLHRCNSTGNGVVVIGCPSSNKCDTALQRCTECVPGTPATCQGTSVATCTVDGLYSLSPCGAPGCKSGKCCIDNDKDTVTDCATPPDCNDNNADVFPGQTKFFDVPVTGSSYDYNCDNSSEQENPGLVECVYGGSSCTGEGWSTTVPACGQTGNWVSCLKSGGSCVHDSPAPKKQRCR